MNHLPALPILIPLFAASIALFFEHRRFGMVPQRIVAWTSIAAMLAVTCVLVGSAASGEVSHSPSPPWSVIDSRAASTSSAIAASLGSSASRLVNIGPTMMCLLSCWCSCVLACCLLV